MTRGITMKKDMKKLVEENKRLKEGIEILKDKKLLQDINESLEEIKKGHFIAL